MLESFIKNMTSLITQMPYEKGKEKATEYVVEKIDQAKLIANIKEQMERYHKDVFQNLSELEQFEYEVLNHYIIEHLFSDICACFYLPEQREREQAKRHLILSAYTYAKATSSEQKKTVYYYIQIFLQIVENHYREAVGESEWFLMGKTVDEIEKLLEKYLSQHQTTIMNAIDYHNSFAKYIDGINPPSDNKKAFHYRNKLIRFQGRKNELTTLYEFLENSNPLLWMAVTGDAGVGKSKLLYHFFEEIQFLQEWKAVWLHMQDCNYIVNTRFAEWNYPCNLVFVIDYAGIAANEIGMWIQILERSRYRPEKIRFILLERETIHKNSETKLEPIWYQNLKGDRIRSECIERLLYQASSESAFLKLTGLNDEDLTKIISDYASTKRKKLDDTTQKWIIEKAYTMERKNDSPRPLIVLLAADAMLEGKQHTADWDIFGLVRHIIEKFRDHWKSVICEGKEELFCALEEIIMFSTCTGGWEINGQLPNPLTDSSTRLLKMDADQLEALICAINEEDTYDGKLQPLEPDLIGEFYVLDYWRRKKYDTEYLVKLSNILWEKPFEFAIFLDRCIQNYGEAKQFYDTFKNGIKIMQPKDNEEIFIILFAMLLVNLSNKQPEDRASETIAHLLRLSQAYPQNEEIALEYAKGLFNLSNKQPEDRASETIAHLLRLSQAYPQNEEIALEYAKGLVNLSNKQPEDRASETIAHLLRLSQAHPKNEEIALEYAKGLFNLSNKQPEDRASETIAHLLRLSQAYPQNEEIALEYAKGLFNLSNKQPEDRASETIAHLLRLSQAYPQNEEIALTYANGLFNLSNKQPEDRASETIAHLLRLSQAYPQNEEIALAYAKGLVNLSNKQTADRASKTIAHLLRLSQVYPQNEEIVLAYAKGLFNLSNKQTADRASETIAHLLHLSQAHPKNEEIALVYAKGLFNLSCEQPEDRASETISHLLRLSQVHPKNEEIVLAYAKGLFNLSCEQPEDRASETISHLFRLSQAYPQNEEIALTYASGLFNLSCEQSEEAAEKSRNQLYELLEKYPRIKSRFLSLLSELSV